MKAVALLAIAMTFSAQAHASWAAIAYHRPTKKSQIFSNSPSKEMAERGAMNACGADCVLVASSEFPYLAFANSDGKGYGFAEDDNAERAVARAVEACDTVAEGAPCHWSKWARNDGDIAHPYGNLYKPGPAHPSLASVGGPWSHTIPNFKGFVVKNDELCWVAAAKTIYYNVTGLEISQFRLAEMDMHIPFAVNVPTDFAPFTPHKNSVQCSAQNLNEPLCNRAGSPQAALKYLGKGLPFDQYPLPTDSAAVYRAIRASLSRNMGVGISFRLFDSSGHILIVYGADYHVDPKNPTLMEPWLYAFDPANGKAVVLKSNTYLADYKMAPETFNGWLTLANYNDPNVDRGVSPRVCPLLAPASLPDACAK